MKTRTSTTRVLGLVLVTAALTGSLAQNGVQPAFASPQPAFPATARATADADSNTQGPAATPRLSPWTSEIVRLAEAGIDDGVVLAFIENCGTFSLGADQIIHLAGAGVSTPVITAMLQHDYDVVSGVKPLTISSRPKLDPEVEKLLARLREAANQSPPIPATASAANPPLKGEPAITPAVEPLPPVVSAITGTEPAWLERGKGEAVQPPKVAVMTPPKVSPQKAGTLYRVPETSAVELVPPILIVSAASPTPNLVVIELFPSCR